MNQLPGNADVWVLAGQSNMTGCGAAEDYEEPSKNVWLYSLRDEWNIAKEPFGIDRYEAIDEAFAIMRGESEQHFADAEYRHKRAAESPAELLKAKHGGGLGLPFGKALSEYTGKPVGLLFCAKGDTRMEEWEPEYKDHPYMALYRATLRRIRSANRPVRGILWYQGESDTFDGKAKLYASRMQKLVAAFRNDLNQPDLPFFFVQIATCVMQTEEELPDWNLIQESQRRLEPVLSPGGMCTAVDLPLWDGIHLSTSSLRRLGQRLAKVVRRKLYNDKGVDVGPRPVSAERDALDPRLLRVKFASVNWHLLPEDRVSGFSIYAAGEKRNLVCSATVSRESKSVVLLRAICPIPTGCNLWYGNGLSPFCNVVDAADLAAPVFGPWTIPDKPGT